MPRGTVGEKSHGTHFNTVTGAPFPIVVYSASIPETDTDAIVIQLDDFLPTGMQARVIGASITASVVSAGSVTVIVGTDADPNGYVTALALSAAGNAFKKCTGALAADTTVGDALFDPGSATADLATLKVTVTTASAATEGLIVTLWLIPLTPPSDIAGR